MKPINKTISQLRKIACEINSIQRMSKIQFSIDNSGKVLAKFEPWGDYCSKEQYWLNPVSYCYPELAGLTYTIKPKYYVKSTWA
jgi:hypothetical protein